MLKTKGIPLWVTIFALIVSIMGFVFGLLAMFGQSFYPEMTMSWGGRSLGLGVVAAVALSLKSPATYIAAFAGGLCVELGDFIEELRKSEPSTVMIISILVFVVLYILGIVSAVKARNMQSKRIQIE